VLTPIEVERLFEVLRQIARDGTSVIFISHKLGEVLAISDRITVLKKGKVTGNLLTKDAAREKLATLMVGRAVLFKVERPDVQLGDPMLIAEDLTVKNEEGAHTVKKVSFTVRRGEILGIAGVSGNGQRDLAEAILGLRKASEGKVVICGKDVTNLHTEKIVSAGAGMIPEDIHEMGIVKNWSIRDNLIVELHSRCPFADAGPLKWLGIDVRAFRNEKEIDKFCSGAIKQFNILAPNGYTLAKNLSGGNLQKLILAREITRGATVLIACQPTRGLDVGATEYVRACLLKYKENGNAILLISEDLDELKMLSDRIAVMYEGEILGIVEPDVENEKIGLLMGGTRGVPDSCK
jgi:simple sugar transport system ATP-binding protein